MQKFTKMPERKPDDWPLLIERHGTDHDRWLIECGGSAIVVSEFNAVRLAASLCVMLGIKIAPKQAKEIRL